MTAPSRRGAEQRAARREELLDAADAVIRASGPDVSMRQIAAGAGITKPILYRYFGDKGGLYRALADRYVEPGIAAVRQALTVEDNVERVHATVDAYLAFIEEHPQIYRFLVHRAAAEQPEAHTAVSAAIRRIGAEVASSMRETRGLEGRDALAAEALGHAIVGMVHVAGDWWVDDQSLPRAELAGHLTALLTHGLAGLDAHLGARSVTTSAG